MAEIGIIRKKNYLLGFTALLFLAFVLLAFIAGYREAIPAYKMFMHVFIAFCYLAGMFIVPKVRNGQLRLLGIFLYNITLAFALRYLFLFYTGDPYEHTYSCDVYAYERIAQRGLERDYFEYMGYLVKFGGFNVDDWGFSTVVVLLYKFFGDYDYVRYLLPVVNSALVTCSAFALHRLCRMFRMDDEAATFATAVYGLFPFWFVSSAMGLKENIFCFLIVFALYYIYLYKETRRAKDLVCAVTFIALTYFFRSAVCLILCITFLVRLYCNEKNRKKFLVLSLLGSVVGILCLNLIVAKFTGFSMESVSATTNSRMNLSVGTGALGWMIQALAAFVGPFPNFSRMGQYGFYFSSGLLFKGMLSLLVNLGIYRIIKDCDWKYYPLAVFVLMGYIMLLLSGVSLDMRYHITFFAGFVIIAARMLERNCVKKPMAAIYVCGLFLLVFYYNLR